MSQKQYAKPALFKDFNKTTNDLLTKNFQAPEQWKLESKFKGPVNTVFVNPQVAKGVISTDVEYVADCGGSVKVNITPDFSTGKATGTYNISGHKVEAVVSRAGAKTDYSIAHETCVMLNKRASINEKLTSKAIELGLGVDVASNCQVGCGAEYNLKDKTCNWNIGTRYVNHAGCEMSILTNKFKSFTTSVNGPVRCNFRGKSHRVTLALQSTCGSSIKEDWNVKVGAEVQCILFPKNTLKLRVDRKGEWDAAYIAKLADNWAVSVSTNKSKKVGVLFTHS